MSEQMLFAQLIKYYNNERRFLYYADVCTFLRYVQCNITNVISIEDGNHFFYFDLLGGSCCQNL